MLVGAKTGSEDPAARETFNSTLLKKKCMEDLKQRIKARPRISATVADMRIAVQEEWDWLQPSDFNKYINQMPQRLAQLKQRKGTQTVL